MGPYLFINAFLAGFFAFGAIYHFILWLRARREWMLLAFTIVTLVGSVQCVAVMSVAMATTVEAAQWALDLRSQGGALTVAALAWLFSTVSGVRPQWYLWTVTIVLASIVLLTAMTGSLTGVVTAVDRTVMPWGETISVLGRTSPSVLLVPVYIVALTVPIFGGICARRLWSRDRVDGALLAVTAAAYSVSIIVAFLIDASGQRLPYPGPVFTAIWVLPMAWEVARTNSQRAVQLAVTERRFRAIFDQTFQFIGLLDVDGTLLEANQTALAFAGVRQEAVIGKPFWETPWWTHSPALQERLREAIRSASLGKVVRFEATHTDVGGHPRHVDFSLKPVRDPSGKVILLIPEGRDITERKEAENALRESEERFRFLIQNQSEFIASCQPDTTLTFVNDSCASYFGLSPDEIVGTSFLPFVAPEFHEEIRNKIATTTPDTPTYHNEVVVLAKGNTRRWNQWTGCGSYDANGRLVSLQLTGRDIHDRVLAEDAKRKLEQGMIQAQRMEALGQLAGGVAHDFNNLLTVIAGHTDMLLSEHSDLPARHDLEQIRLASERAASMTRQLLAFSRQSVLELKVISLNTVVAQTEAMLRRTIGEHIELSVKTTPDLHHVKADADQIGRVLVNIAVNARDAMPDGGKLVIETRNVTSAIDSDGAPMPTPGPFVLLAISDTGCGMTTEIKSRLFEPFYTTKGQGKGTGLGLAVVDGVVKQSGGRIDVYSEPGVGTTFKIYLPAVERADADDGSRADPRSTARGTETVLLVEDETAVREMTQEALQRRGYTVLPAASGDQALAIARENLGRIHLVLTDVVMPGMSGPQLVEQLRTECPGLAALFMSGYTSDAVLRHGIETGEADFLQKPFSTSALAAKIRQVLDRV